MAQHQVDQVVDLDFPSRLHVTAGSVAKSTADVATPANYASLNALDTRLNAISATAFSTSGVNGLNNRLDTMTENDKIYALRVLDDPTTI